MMNNYSSKSACVTHHKAAGKSNSLLEGNWMGDVK